MRYRIAVVGIAAIVIACVKTNGGRPDYGLHLHAPPEIAGDVRIALESDLQGMVSGASICDLRWKSGSAPAPNLLEGRQLGAGALGDLLVRPGAYHIDATSCTGEAHGGDIVVRGPTVVHFGYGQSTTPPVDQATHVRLVFTMPEYVRHPAPAAYPPADQRAAPDPNCKPRGAEVGWYTDCCSQVMTGTRCD